MCSGILSGDANRNSFQPWFIFGPFLILILYWLGSTSGYILASMEEYVTWCFPHFDGCTSISRTGRSGTSFYVFKFTMIPVAGLVFVYWLDMARWHYFHAGIRQILGILPTILGCLGATALLSQMIFLGIDCGICRTIRSQSTTLFFFATFIAQWLVWTSMRKQSERKWVPIVYFTLCLVLSIDLVLFVTIPNIAENTGGLENSVAWRASYLVALAPAVSACGWIHPKTKL